MIRPSGGFHTEGPRTGSLTILSLMPQHFIININRKASIGRYWGFYTESELAGMWRPTGSTEADGIVPTIDPDTERRALEISDRNSQTTEISAPMALTYGKRLVNQQG
jgi:hypothetical protein